MGFWAVPGHLEKAASPQSECLLTPCFLLRARPHRSPLCRRHRYSSEMVSWLSTRVFTSGMGGLREAHCWAPRWGSHELEKIFESMLGTTTLHLMLSKHICSQVHYTCMAYSGLQLPSTYIYIILERKKNVFYSCWKLFRCLSKAKANKQRYFHHHVAH